MRYAAGGFCKFLFIINIIDKKNYFLKFSLSDINMIDKNK